MRKDERQLTVERERKEEESLIFWVTRPIRHVGLTLYEAEYVDVIKTSCLIFLHFLHSCNGLQDVPIAWRASVESGVVCLFIRQTEVAKLQKTSRLFVSPCKTVGRQRRAGVKKD